MEKIIIRGGKKLSGEVRISTAKNAALPIIVASILSNNLISIKNAPLLEDVFVLCQILSSLGIDINIDYKNAIINIDNRNLKSVEPNSELVRRMRASSLLMGPLLARFGQFKITLPGGCNIGSRPIDLHLKGLSALGADIEVGHGYVSAKAKKLIGNSIYLDFPSVGATENIMMAAVLAEGTTIIENAAEEPEIKDLADFLNSIGGNVKGAGGDKILIEGVKELRGSNYTPIYDRIEAGTFMIAAAITKSLVNIHGVNEEHLRPIIAKLAEIGVIMEFRDESVIIDGRESFSPVDIKTMPYPGFPTDMQSQMMSLLSIVRGTSIITETIFENRFMHTSELKRMGANIKIDGRSAIIQGVNKLTGAEVKATDLRAGAALIIAGLVADGTTIINGVHHIDRGYVNVEEKFKSLGADIYRA